MSYNVLITGSGNVTGLNVIKSLVKHEDVYLVGCDFDDENPSRLFCKNYKVPRCADAGYPAAIKSIIESEHITHVIASNDHDVRALSLLSEKEDRFPIFNGYAKNILNCLDKRATEQLFLDAGVLTPTILTDKKDYPYVLRIENMGKRKKFVHIVRSEEDQEQIPEEDYAAGLMSRYVEGVEYTVDVICDQNSNLIVAVPRERITVVRGMVHHAKIVKDEQLIAQCGQIAKSVGLVGMSCIQCIKTKDEKYYFIEINPRPGSGIDLSINAGADMPYMWLQCTSGDVVKTPDVNWGLQMKRYYCGYFF